MRVIAGSARGRKLLAPKGRGTRPTPDRVRESVFSIVAAILPGARVLDLFAGTGALGLEALSRGAASAAFVERAKDSLAILRKNIDAVGIDGAEVLAMPARAALSQLADRGARFDLVFLDPPYDAELLAPTLVALASGALLAPEAVVVCEHRGNADAPAATGLQHTGTRRFGDVAVSLFRPQPAQER